MSRSRGRRVRLGDGGGGRPSQGGGGGLRGGTGDTAASSIGVAGGGNVVHNKNNRPQQRLHGEHLHYSPGEERAVRMKIEKGLRLRRLEQVRQQSREQAAAVREEYRLRREENKRAALRESKVLHYAVPKIPPKFKSRVQERYHILSYAAVRNGVIS